jgi:hypothetical protein
MTYNFDQYINKQARLYLVGTDELYTGIVIGANDWGVFFSSGTPGTSTKDSSVIRFFPWQGLRYVDLNYQGSHTQAA